MTWVLTSLAVLAAATVVSLALALARYPRWSLGTAMLGVVGAAALLILAAGAVFFGSPSWVVQSVEWSMPLGSARLAVDGLSAWFLVVIGCVSIAAAIYSWGYFRGPSTHGPVGAYGPLVCIMVAALVLVVCAADVVLFLVGWESMSLSAFFLVGFHDQEAEARRGAWTYLVATHLATGLGVLPVLAAFVARSGGTAMSGFAGAFGASEVTACVAVFLLGVVGFGTKAGFMPFHVWLPEAHPVAPSPVSALMSGVVIKTGIYGLLRLLSWLPDLPVGCAMGLMVLSLVTGIVGILYALGQRQIKRMLAYSSVENIGIIGLAISVGVLGRTLHQPALVAFGIGGALLHVLNHALFKGLLFLSAGAVLHDTGTGDVERLGGLAQTSPVNALAFLIGSVAICALPPLNGFISEFAIYTGVLRGVVSLPASYAAVLAASAAALALIGGLALAVFSRTFSVVFLGTRRDRNVSVHATPPSMKAGMLILAASCVVVAAASPGLVTPLSAALTPFAGDGLATATTLAEFLAPLARMSRPFVVLMVVAGGLLALRRRLPLGAAAGGAASAGDAEPPYSALSRKGGEGTGNAVATWGCGYAYPRATMQYTGSSYAWRLVQSFRHVVRPRRDGPNVAGCFPQPGRLVTGVTDLARDRIYEPAFRRLARMFERLWPLQHGRIQLYLVYIVVTVVIVFIVEACMVPVSARRTDLEPSHDRQGVLGGTPLRGVTPSRDRQGVPGGTQLRGVTPCHDRQGVPGSSPLHREIPRRDRHGAMFDTARRAQQGRIRPT